jgi:hypothetical protein
MGTKRAMMMALPPYRAKKSEVLSRWLCLMIRGNFRIAHPLNLRPIQ